MLDILIQRIYITVTHEIFTASVDGLGENFAPGKLHTRRALLFCDMSVRLLYSAGSALSRNCHRFFGSLSLKFFFKDFPPTNPQSTAFCRPQRQTPPALLDIIPHFCRFLACFGALYTKVAKRASAENLHWIRCRHRSGDGPETVEVRRPDCVRLFLVPLALLFHLSGHSKLLAQVIKKCEINDRGVDGGAKRAQKIIP